VFELAHFVDGLRNMMYVLDGGRGNSDDARVSRLVSTGPANIWHLWNLRPEKGEGLGLAEIHEIMEVLGAGTDEGAFDDAFHHFEVSRNISAFDATRTRALLDVGQQQTEEALLQLESLMQPPSCVSCPPPGSVFPNPLSYADELIPVCPSNPSAPTSAP
jgi:hypothetical protein